MSALAIVVGICIPAFVGTTLYRQRADDLRAAEVIAENTARALEQHATSTLETIDAYLQAVISLIGAGMDNVMPEVVHQALRERMEKSSHVHNFLIVNASGELVHEGASYPVRPRDRRDRDFFEKLQDNPNLGLVVGRPRIGVLSGKPTIPVARRIYNADGSFGGVIMASLDPGAFQSVYNSLELGHEATVTLWREDGMILVRTPHVPELIGKSFAAGENYKKYVLTRDTRPFRAVGSTDGITRVIAYRFAGPYPIYISAAISETTALAKWRRSALTQAAVAGGLTIVLVACLLLLAVELRRRQRANLQIRQAEAEARTSTELLRATLDNMVQG